ncbi:homeobox protein Nkx-6.1-like [Schistocerca nitens]|uniref:homeobox protein Nkx-6.1-like n=1 Tax=Schistocerca nitens TaxID=7011 RepID=UPI002118D02B|nr:homeobox protein Nkx-6.1-like [Schistocerca nitens]
MNPASTLPKHGSDAAATGAQPPRPRQPRSTWVEHNARSPSLRMATGQPPLVHYISHDFLAYKEEGQGGGVAEPITSKRGPGRHASSARAPLVAAWEAAAAAAAAAAATSTPSQHRSGVHRPPSIRLAGQGCSNQTACSCPKFAASPPPPPARFPRSREGIAGPFFGDVTYSTVGVELVGEWLVWKVPGASIPRYWWLFWRYWEQWQ